MRRVNGIEAGRIIRQMQASAIIIFLTVSKQYALEGYEAEPLRYLLKEDNEEKQKIQIEPVLNIAIKRMKEEEKSILLHKNGQVFSIKISSIMYVDIFRHQCTFHIKDGTVYKENYSLKGAEQKLDDPRFVRCHKSYLVNIQHIQHIEKNNIIMNNGEKVYLSRGKAKLIKCAILDYWGQ
jgi:DNA-binding LytR/AlgR family response regulator